jgi:hypothetical protein
MDTATYAAIAALPQSVIQYIIGHQASDEVDFLTFNLRELSGSWVRRSQAMDVDLYQLL